MEDKIPFVRRNQHAKQCNRYIPVNYHKYHSCRQQHNHWSHSPQNKNAHVHVFYYLCYHNLSHLNYRLRQEGRAVLAEMQIQHLPYQKHLLLTVD